MSEPTGAGGPSPASPTTRAARHARIAALLAAAPVRSQAQLAQALAQAGVSVTQATLSRDLDELGATKVRTHDGRLYALPAEGGPVGDRPPHQAGAGWGDVRLARLAEELVTTVATSGDLVVARTPPGAAQFFASAADHAGLDGVVGTIAGDDTVLLIARAGAGAALAANLLALASGEPLPVPPLPVPPLLPPLPVPPLPVTTVAAPRLRGCARRTAPAP